MRLQEYNDSVKVVFSALNDFFYALSNEDAVNNGSVTRAANTDCVISCLSVCTQPTWTLSIRNCLVPCRDNCLDALLEANDVEQQHAHSLLSYVALAVIIIFSIGLMSKFLQIVNEQSAAMLKNRVHPRNE